MFPRLLTGLGLAAIVLSACSSSEQAARGLADSTEPSASVAASAPEAGAESGGATPSESPAAEAGTVSPEPLPSATSSQGPAAKLTVTGGRFINGCRIAPNTQCSGADLRKQDLTAVRLSGANLSYANLSESDLSEADLTNANLTGADLSGANFTGAILTGARLDKATLCNTVIFGKVDSSNCPATPKPTRKPSSCKDATIGGGWGNYGSDQLIGSLVLVPYPTMLKGLRVADGSSVPVNQFTPLYAVLGNAFGGGAASFFLPDAVGDWAGLSGSSTGTATCLTWAIASSGVFPMRDTPPDVLPNEVLFVAIPPSSLTQWKSAGFIDTGLGSKVGPGITALAGPPNGYDDSSVPMGELRLFRGPEVPPSFRRADGSVVKAYEYSGLNEALGSEYSVDGGASVRLPKMTAPDGYTWGVSVQGPFPERS